MKRPYFLLLFSVCFLVYATRSLALDACVQCHSGLTENRLVLPIADMKEDVHSRAGFSCADCHGGDSTASPHPESLCTRVVNPPQGFFGKPRPIQIPKLCARCHSSLEFMRQYSPSMPTDQYDQFLTSGHGKGNQKGDTLDASCVSCHGGHGIKPASDSRSPVHRSNISRTCGKCHSDPDYMKGYNLPTDQVEKYEKSVHGLLLLSKDDPSTPTCNDCHGKHGSFPPAANALSQSCDRCHLKSRNNCDLSPHREAFIKLGLSQCDPCHRYHDTPSSSDDDVGLDSGVMCADCHDEGTAAGQGTIVMRGLIEDLKQRIVLAEATAAKAEKGGYDISKTRFALTEATNQLITARTAVHLCDTTMLKEVTSKGVSATEKAIASARVAIGNMAYRRRMIALFSLVVLLTAGALYLKMREIGTGKKNGK